MTKLQAEKLAKNDRHYIAKRHRDGTWGVWCCVSDHWVEFDNY
jgi:hypothetical protein